MTINLLDTLSYALGDRFTDLAAGTGVVFRAPGRDAIGTIVPVLLGGLLRHGDTPDGAAALLGLLDRTDRDLTETEAATAQPDTDPQQLMAAGRTLLVALFGDRLGTVAEAIAPGLRLDAVTAARMMALAAPLVLGKLKCLTEERHLDADGLGQLLAEQKPLLAAALPDSLSTALGLGSLAPSAGSTAADASERIRPPPPPSGSVSPPPALRRWLPWLIIAVAALLALTQLRHCAHDALPPDSAPPGPVSATATPPGPVRLYFDIGSITAPDNSERQLQAIIDYARARADVRVAVSGYRDRTGSRAMNDALAQDRAHSIKAVLVLAGIQVERIDLEKPLEIAAGSPSREAYCVEVSVR